MTTTMSIRELTRNGSIFAEYDYIDIEDRKSHEYKGVFISSKYADDVKKFLEKKIAKEKQVLLDEITKFAGSNKMEERYKGLEGKELMKEVSKAKVGL